jgi:hypothetical protein
VERRRIMEGINQTRAQCVCIWKCCNETPLQISHTNKNAYKREKTRTRGVLKWYSACFEAEFKPQYQKTPPKTKKTPKNLPKTKQNPKQNCKIG